MKKQKCSVDLCAVQERKIPCPQEVVKNNSWNLWHGNKIRTIVYFNAYKQQGEINRFQVLYLLDGCRNYYRNCSKDSSHHSYTKYWENN
jgi:hypothetical protein